MIHSTTFTTKLVDTLPLKFPEGWSHQNFVGGDHIHRPRNLLGYFHTYHFNRRDGPGWSVSTREEVLVVVVEPETPTDPWQLQLVERKFAERNFDHRLLEVTPTTSPTTASIDFTLELADHDGVDGAMMVPDTVRLLDSLPKYRLIGNYLRMSADDRRLGYRRLGYRLPDSASTLIYVGTDGLWVSTGPLMVGGELVVWPKLVVEPMPLAWRLIDDEAPPPLEVGVRASDDSPVVLTIVEKPQD